MEFRAIDIVITLILNIIHCAYTLDHILSCNVTSLEPCKGKNQICNGTSHECICLPEYTLVNNECEKPEAGGESNHDVTLAIVTIFTLALVICGLVLVIRKYNLVEYARQKINLRRNNDVMYEDVMIGQDDPPLSP